MKRSTVFTLLIIGFILSFFVTPLGDWSKSGLMRLFASPPDIISFANQKSLPSYDWRLRNDVGNYFNFSKSKGKVVFIHFWASWHTPSAAELKDIEKLYDNYHEKVDFYIITNEERYPVEQFMEKKEYGFPITFRIVGEPSPLNIPDPSGAYLVDKDGKIVIRTTEIQDWYNQKMTQLLDSLISKP